MGFSEGVIPMHDAVDLNTQKLPVDETTAETVKGFLEDGFAARMFNPLDDPEATANMHKVRETWRDQERTVVFTSGVFDVMHGNHRAYLLTTKLAGVAIHFNRYEAEEFGKPWSELGLEIRRDYAAHALSSDLVKQIVSVDGDDAVAQRKGFTVSKGNMARPIYGWDSRARDVLSSSISAPDGSGARFVADAVTIHDNVHAELAETPHNDIMEIAHSVEPDVWAIYYESEDIIGALAREVHNPRNPQIQPVIIERGQNFYTDKMLGGPFSTTALALRINGTATAQAS